MIGEKLSCEPGLRDEALTFDKYALVAYKRTDCNDDLVGHAPIDISQF